MSVVDLQYWTLAPAALIAILASRLIMIGVVTDSVFLDTLLINGKIPLIGPNTPLLPKLSLCVIFLSCGKLLCPYFLQDDTNYGSDGNNSARAFQISFTFPNITSTTQDVTITSKNK